MDRIAVISDIHGNMPALKSVLEDIKRRGIKRIFCLGDIAGKGPSGVEAVDCIRKVCEVVIQGNWDYLMTQPDRAAASFLWHMDKLGEERLNYLGSLPMYKEFYLSGRLVRLCHASPHDIFHRVYVNSPVEERLKLFKSTRSNPNDSDIVGYGDIHGAYINNFDGKTLFNTGSVGNPLDITMASYAIIEGIYSSHNQAPWSINVVKVPYDIEKAIELAKASDMPEIESYINELRTGIYRGRQK